MRSVTGVALTAFPPAANRMAESQRPDRWFNDELAAEFLAAGRWVETDGDPEGAAWVILRTRFFDEFLLRAAAEGCRQIVLLGAGLDTRSFRLPWPAGVVVYEVDHPDLLSFKDGVIAETGQQPRCRRRSVPGDLTADWAEAVGAAGFDPAVPTAWLLEGVLAYLPAPDVERLMAAIGSRSAPGSQLAVTAATASMPAHPDGRVWAIRGAVEEWLAGHGWSASVHDVPDCARRYGRPDLEVGQVGKLIEGHLGPRQG